MECCSDSSISFHYMLPEMQQKLAKILQDYSKQSSMPNSKPIPLFKYIVDRYFKKQ